LLELGNQAGEKSGSAGEQLVSNEVDAYMKKKGWSFVWSALLFLGCPVTQKSPF
jgi:hypothetical protein